MNDDRLNEKRVTVNGNVKLRERYLLPSYSYDTTRSYTSTPVMVDGMWDASPSTWSDSPVFEGSGAPIVPDGARVDAKGDVRVEPDFTNPVRFRRFFRSPGGEYNLQLDMNALQTNADRIHLIMRQGSATQVGNYTVASTVLESGANGDVSGACVGTLSGDESHVWYGIAIESAGTPTLSDITLSLSVQII